MAEEKRYFWLKLYDDFFTSKRIKKLRKIAGGDTYVIIYLKMQLMAMKHDGILKWSGLEEKFADELALDMDEDPANVEVTLRYLISCGLAEASDDLTEVFLPYAVKNVGSEGAAAQRMRDYRARKNNALPRPERNVVTTPCEIGYGEKEIESEIESEIYTGSKEPVCRTGDVRRIVTAWNETGLTQVMKVTAETKRGRALKARIRENGVDGVLKAIENVKNSPFLKGKNKRGFVASFDWLITSPDNFQKTLEGNYTQKFAPVDGNPTIDHTSEAYQIAQYLAKEKARDNPGRANPTEAEMQKQAAALDELHEQNGVAWDTVDNVLYFALNSPWWGKKVQSTFDLKRYFNEIFADMVKEQGPVKEE